MHINMLNEITALSIDNGASFKRDLADPLKNIDEDWIIKIHAALEILQSKDGVKLDNNRAHCDGARITLGGILKHLGPKSELLEHRAIIQEQARLYLTWLGFRGANRVLVNNVGSEPNILAAPELIHEQYRLAVKLLGSLELLFTEISNGTAPPLSQNQTIGTLILLLMIRDGIISFSEIRMVLHEISSGRLARYSNLWYVLGPTSKDGSHIRRAFLSKPTVIAATSWNVANTSDIDSKKLIRNAIESLSTRLNPAISINKLSFQSLQKAASSYLRLQEDMIQHVADYIEGNLISDSLAESCFTRIMELNPNPSMLNHEEALKAQRDRPRLQPIERPGLVKSLVDTLQKTRPDKLAKKETISLISKSRNIGQPHLVILLLDWVEWMVNINGIRCSTAGMHLTNFSRGIFASVNNLDIKISNPDDWEILVESMLKKSSDYDKLKDAIAKFSSFLSYKFSTNFSHHGYAREANVNAWCLSEEEKDEAINILIRRFEASEPVLADYGRQIIELAYYLGTRRWEILGLYPYEIVGTRTPWVQIKPNVMRDIKTDCSERQIPLKLITKFTFYSKWLDDCKSYDSSDKLIPIVEHIGINITKKEKKLFDMINSSIQEAIGSCEVSFHTLRHSATCRMILAIYWSDLDLADFGDIPYFSEIANTAESIKNILVRKSNQNFTEHKTVSTILGHLSYRTTAGHYFHHYCILRLGILRKIHKKNSWLESTDCFKGISGRLDVLDVSESDAFELIIKNSLNRFQIYEKKTLTTTNKEAPIDDNLRSRIRVISEVAIRSMTEQDTRLREFIPADAERHQYIKMLNDRTKLVENHFSYLCIRKDKGVESSFVMPTDVPAQEGIHRILQKIGATYSSTEDLRGLSMDLIILATHMMPKENGAFSFKSKNDAVRALDVIYPLLSVLKIRIHHWHRYSQRVPGKKHPVTMLNKHAYVNHLSDLPDYPIGTLLDSFEPLY